jgi:DNA-binding PadR family transcriptional regulator
MDEIKTSTVESLLGVLSLGPMSGYEMRQFMERSTGNFWSESFGQIYPALKSMLRDGLVTIVDGGEDSRAGKKVYRITEAGEQQLRRWLGAPAKPQVRRHELLLKVFFGDRAERGTIAAHVAEYRHRFAEDLERYEGIQRRLKVEYKAHPAMPFWLMTLRFGVTEAKALMGWCDETLAELKKQESGGSHA